MNIFLYVILIILSLLIIYATSTHTRARKSLNSTNIDSNYREMILGPERITSLVSIISGILLFLAGYSIDRWDAGMTVTLALFGCIAFFFAITTNPTPKARDIYKLLLKQNRKSE